MLAALLAASWFATDWTGEGSGEYPGGTVLRDDAGEILRVSLGKGDIDCRPYYLADPEDWIAKAIVASEDGTFWSHHGVRPLSVLRAACQNIVYRRRVSGASTITMQAVRLIKPHPKTFWWKFKEAILAAKMERARDKRWILSQYLNRAPFGSNLVGIEAAANGWFGKGAKDLGLGEAAMLAGMVQAPSRFRPDRGYDRAIARRDYVLGRMLELGMIGEEQAEAARSVRPEVRRAPRPFKAPWFCDWAERRARGCGDVTTTLNADVQRMAERAVDAAATGGGRSAAAIVARADTGDVIALACSGNYFDATGGQVNTALALRPAGSTLKPFLAALAMDRGIVAPGSMLADVPMAVKGYRPENFDSRYRGSVTLRDSLVLSLNVPFVRLLDRVGVSTFGDCLCELGFSALERGSEQYGLGLAIGNAEVSLMELVNAYGAFARGGGGTFSSAAAYLVSDMLSGDERSSAALGHVADVAVPRFAWKTGTSSAYRDAWTIAWSPKYVIGVWCGHKSGGFGDSTVVGAKAAAPAAWSIVRALHPQNDGPWFQEPAEVAQLIDSCPAADSLSQPVQAARLEIAKPEDGAVFTLVPGMGQQKVSCRAIGGAAAGRLWWFVDGRHAGESTGGEPFAAEIAAGRHTLTCAAEDGLAATVGIDVRAL